MLNIAGHAGYSPKSGLIRGARGLLIRSVALQAYEVAARAIGIEPFGQMSQAGLDVTPPIDGETFVPYAPFVRLLERTAEIGHCPDFGLRVAQWPDEYFEGPLVTLLQHADSLREAIELSHRFGYAYCGVLRPSLAAVPDAPERVDLVFGSGDGGADVQAVEFMMSTVLRALRLICGHEGRDWSILLPHRMSLAAERYRDYLAAECRFEMPFAAVRIARCELNAPLPARSPWRVQMAIRYIEAQYARNGDSVRARVRDLLRQRLGTLPVMQGDIAAAMSVHEKTLQRRLAKEGSSFHVLLDEVRRECFLELMRQPQRSSLAQTALMLGYSEQAALSRSCQRWFGASPSAVARVA